MRLFTPFKNEADDANLISVPDRRVPTFLHEFQKMEDDFPFPNVWFHPGPRWFYDPFDDAS